MPMSDSFRERLYPILPQVIKHFGTPFHIYDEQGIVETGENLKRDFADVYGFREFFAVKALPNPRIMTIIRDMGFGFDCSSIDELQKSRRVGAGPDDIMFTSNNTSPEEFNEALTHGGCILNLDDLVLIPKVPEPFPELICFRYNPGLTRRGNNIIGDPVEAKYGVRTDQIVEAYRRAMSAGAKKFGLHAMICSNELDWRYMLQTVEMLLGVIEMVAPELDIDFEFLNIGGGLSIPYKLGDEPFDVASLAGASELLLYEFRKRHHYAPKLFMEAGRYLTGPHGILVTTAINRMSKYREYVGVDACMSSLMRPGMYRPSGGGYHHITVFGKEGKPTEIVDVVGSLCENNDKFAVQRELPKVAEGDWLIIHDTGAHGLAMCFQYNGRPRPPELLFTRNCTVELIRRRETVDDLNITLQHEPDVLRF